MLTSAGWINTGIPGPQGSEGLQGLQGLTGPQGPSGVPNYQTTTLSANTSLQPWSTSQVMQFYFTLIGNLATISWGNMVLSSDSTSNVGTSIQFPTNTIPLAYQPNRNTMMFSTNVYLQVYNGSSVINVSGSIRVELSGVIFFYLPYNITTWSNTSGQPIGIVAGSFTYIV